MKRWEVVIGLETHVQLATRSKIFSGASTAFGAPPNTQACPVDLALPGVLPTMNAAALECAVTFGLAVGAEVAPRSVFARKNYFYPDLPKGYQISQYEIPVVSGGGLAIAWEEGGEPRAKVVRLTRAHLEEDAGKSLHEDAMRTLGGAAMAGLSGIDLNRAGTPLLEIVTEPDMRSSAEAVACARALHGLVTWLGICDGNMQEGSFRVDANVSVRPLGQAAFGTRCEIKNLNSFRFMQQAIEHEVRRQVELIEDGGRVVQETRLYDPDRDETRSMRSKEDAHDYRYFPDPDLPTLVVEPALLERVRAAMPELPAQLRARWVEAFGLTDQDAAALTATRATAGYFERTVAELAALAPAGPDATPQRLAKLAANWTMGDVAAQLNREGLDVAACPVSPAQLARLIARVVDGTVSGKIGREVFQAIWDERRTEPDAADRVIDARGLRQISDTGAIERIVDEVLAANPKSVEEFRAGKEKAFNALVGQAMKATRGKANPQQVNELLRRKLGAA
jgi:aspartyl-tRNA(Asn)/glutamyl-tRNA(Gln) amidotransferase subunit B